MINVTLQGINNFVHEGNGLIKISGPTYDYVEIGGIKWATCNVGATKPEELGKYFQWGDTVGYYKDQGAAEHSYWSTCPFNNGASYCDSTYFYSVSGTVCPGYILAPQYDAATVQMGVGWRLPTKEEIINLTANTTYQWTTLNGVQGGKFTSKTDTSKFIFFPASGTYFDGSFTAYNKSELWSCEHGTYSHAAYSINFYNNNNVSYGLGNRNPAFQARGVFIG